MQQMGYGYGNMAAMNGYSGSSMNGFLMGFLVLLVKLLMVVLVIAVIIGIIMWVKNNFFNNNDFQIVSTIKNDPILKTVTVITLAVLGIILVIGLFSSFLGQGVAFSAFSVYWILALLIKVLSFVLVVSLICALIAYVKKQYDAGNFKSSKTETYPNEAGE